MDKIVFKFSQFGGEDVECGRFQTPEYYHWVIEDLDDFKKIFLGLEYSLHRNFSHQELEDYAKILDEELPNILHELGITERYFSFFEGYDFDFCKIYENILKYGIVDKRIADVLQVYEDILCHNQNYLHLREVSNLSLDCFENDIEKI